MAGIQIGRGGGTGVPIGKAKAVPALIHISETPVQKGVESRFS